MSCMSSTAPTVRIEFSNSASPYRKKYRSGTHRVFDPGSTLRTVRPLIARLGVTRVADVTGLDYVGIPVVMSVRPSSKSLSVHQGKGVTLDEARVSAIMEAVEFFCAELPHSLGVERSARALGEENLVLPRQLMRRRLPPDAAIRWVRGYDLLKGREVFVPEELIMVDFTRPEAKGRGWFLVTSNGLAAGNTKSEALLHAICELIERDAFSLWLQAPADLQARTRIDPSTIDEGCVGMLMKRYRASAIDVHVWETTSDFGVPSFFCLIDDRNRSPPFLGRSGGNGCHPSVAIALCRALTEAAQSRLTLISGARDDIAPENYTMIGWQNNLSSLVAHSMDATIPQLFAIRATSFDASSIEEDLRSTVARLVRCGIGSIVVVDLTRPDLAIPCFRVVIPGLEGMYHKPGYKRGRRAFAALRSWR
jgi:YcaO-like protein with predicted kinase domain